MVDEKEEKRPWWAVKRIQGLGIMTVGIAMLFFPVTAPVAGTVIAVGAGWTGAGAVAAKVSGGSIFGK